jgi:ubiquitin-protein ligase
MNFSDRRIQTQYEAFQESAPCIEEYFQITHSKYKLVQHTNREYIFTIYKEHSYSVGLDLPREIRIYIHTFLYEYKVVSYKITIPPSYPFKAPIWSMYTISTNMPTKRDELAVHYQNHRYDVSWSPVITFEKDILNMIDSYETCIEHCNANGQIYKNF